MTPLRRGAGRPDPRPPRWLERWLSALAGRHGREFLLGDLQEEYRRIIRDRGTIHAFLWYGREVTLTIRSRLFRGRRQKSSVDHRPRATPGDHILGSVAALARQARFFSRSMWRRPGQAALIVLTLSAGIGATTGVFSIVDHVLLRPLPYDRPHELIDVWNVYTQWRDHEVLSAYWDRIRLSYPEYEQWKRNQTAFREIALHSAAEGTLTGRGEPTRILVGRSTASLWSLLGSAPALGRAFSEEEDGPGATHLALLSHEIWISRWGGDPGVLGQTVELDGDAYGIIGVLPAGFRFGPVDGPNDHEPISVWIPVGADGAELDDPGNHVYEAIARLGPGGSIGEAQEETRRLLAGGRPADVRDVRLTPRQDEEIGTAKGPLLLLLGAVSVLMLIACVNVATLFLGNVAGRRTELATRSALGAGRGRLVAMLAGEALGYGALATAGGFALGSGILRLLLRWAPDDLPLPPNVGLDLRVLGIMAAVGLGVSLVFGLVPAVLVRRLDLHGELKRGPGRNVARGWRAQRALVGAQFGLSVVLLVGSGLLGRSLAAELSVDPGFDGTGLVSLDLTLPERAYPTAASRSDFLRAVTELLRSLPGSTSVTGATALPFSGRGGSSSFDIRGREVPPETKKPEAVRRSILPGFAETLGIPILQGRSIGPEDRDDAPPVVLVSRSMAERFWPGESPLGEFIVRDNREWEIVGLVDDVLMENLRSAPQPTFYTPIHQEEAGVRTSVTLVVRSASPLEAVVPPLRRAVWELDPTLALDAVDSVPALLARSMAPQRYRTFLLSLFAIIATVLSACGAFGVVARGLVHRTRDLGIRLALGARPSRLVAQEIGRESIAVAAGVLIGVTVAAGSAKVIGRFLFGVSAFDPVTYAAAAVGLGGLGLLAAWVATRRIIRLDPVRVLRAD